MDQLPVEIQFTILDLLTGTELLNTRCCQLFEFYVQTRIVPVKSTYDADAAVDLDDALSLIHARGLDWNKVFKASFEKRPRINILARKKITDWRPSLSFLRLKNRYDICYRFDSSFVNIHRKSMYNKEIDIYIGKVYPEFAMRLLDENERYVEQHECLMRGVCMSGKEEHIRKLTPDSDIISELDYCLVLSGRSDLLFGRDDETLDSQLDAYIHRRDLENTEKCLQKIISKETDLSCEPIITAITTDQYELANRLLALPHFGDELLIQMITRTTPVDTVVKIINCIDTSDQSDEEEKSAYKEMALWYAYEYNRLDLIDALTTMGITSPIGRTEWAIRRGSYELIDPDYLEHRFEQHGRDISSALMYVNDKRYEKLLRIYKVRAEVADYIHSLGYEYTLGDLQGYSYCDIYVPALKLYIACKCEYLLGVNDSTGDTLMILNTEEDFTNPIDWYIMEFG